MERSRHRKSKGISGNEGFHQNQKHKGPAGLASDSSSAYLDGNTRDHRFLLEMGQSSTRRSTARPVVKLLAEMYKGMKPKRKSPSFITRLMGLDRKQFQGYVGRKQKRLPESYPQNNAAVDIRQNGQLYAGLSNRRSSVEKRESKDLYEDLDPSYFMNRRYSSRLSASSMFTKFDMAFNKRRSSDAKRLSMYEDLQVSELDDSVGLPGSKDMLAKYSRNWGSSSARNLHDLQVNPRCSDGSHVAVLKPSNSKKYEGSEKARISKRGSSSRLASSHMERKDGLLLDPSYCCGAHTSNIQLEEKNAELLDSSKIVVLKPNLKNMQNSGMPGSSQDLSHGYVPKFRGTNEYPSAGGQQNVSWRNKDSFCSIGISKGLSKEARNIGRRTPRRMRDACDESSDTKSSLFRGYAGDESSFDAEESDSDSEWEVFAFSSRKSHRGSNKGYRHPSSGSVERVNREAKRRLSERWRITEKYQDLEIVSRDSTPGEMLSTPEEEIRSRLFNAKIGLGGSNSQLGSNRGRIMCEDHSGIGSKDGWKDENQGTSISMLASGNNRKGAYHDELAEKRQLLCGNTAHRCRSKADKGNLDSKFRSKNCFPCEHTSTINFSAQAEFELKMEANFKNTTEQQHAFQLAARDDMHGSTGSNQVLSEDESTTLSFKSFQSDPEQSSGVAEDKAAIWDQEDFCLQETTEEVTSSAKRHGPQPAASESSNEAVHTSPVSVLKVHSTEDVSSCPECFDRLNVEIHELRMQLQLLNMEYSTCSLPLEGIALLSSILSGGNCSFNTEGWEVSYLLDLLIHSGLKESSFNILQLMWHSPDSPLDPSSYDDLEKKYGDNTFGSVPERKLLFDRIDLALFDIFQQHIDQFPWVMPGLAGLCLTKKKEGARDALEQIIKQEYASGKVPEKVLDRELQWTDYRGEINIIGIEIEILLIHDMIDEFLCDI